MKVLFAHDHFFVREGASFFSSTGSFTNSVVERYTKVFDNVLFLTRQKKLSEAQQSQRLSPVRVNNVSFKEVPDFKSLATYHRISEAKKIIGAAVQSADCLIARLPSSIGSNARKFAFEEFDEDKVIERLVEIYKAGVQRCQSESQ